MSQPAIIVATIDDVIAVAAALRSFAGVGTAAWRVEPGLRACVCSSGAALA
jgi:hypothetical protein